MAETDEVRLDVPMNVNPSPFSVTGVARQRSWFRKDTGSDRGTPEGAAAVMSEEGAGWMPGLQGLLGMRGNPASPSAGANLTIRDEIIMELSTADPEARASFQASLDAKQSAKGALREDDLEECLEELRMFKRMESQAKKSLGMKPRGCISCGWLTSTASDFKAFISRGSVVDLAVGMVMATAFSAIVATFISAFITPCIQLMFGSVDGLLFTVKGVDFHYGKFLAACMQFFFSALFLYFVVLKPFNVLIKTWDNLSLFHRMKQILSPVDEEHPDSALQGVTGQTKECTECLSAIPLKAKRCRYCSCPVDVKTQPASLV